MELTRKQGRRHKKLLDDLKDRKGHSHLKEEALDCTMWRNHFGRGIGPVVRQNTERTNESQGRQEYPTYSRWKEGYLDWSHLA